MNVGLKSANISFVPLDLILQLVRLLLVLAPVFSADTQLMLHPRYLSSNPMTREASCKAIVLTIGNGEEVLILGAHSVTFFR